MKYLSLCIILVLSASVDGAENEPLDLEPDSSTIYRRDSKGFSWMYNKKYQFSDERQSNECQRLAQRILDIRESKGMHSRNFALERRYEAECVR